MTDVYADAGIADDRFEVIGESSIDQVYAPRTGEGRFALLAQLREVALAQDGVREALYRRPNPLDGGAQHTVAAVHPGWRSAGERAGDLVLVAEEGAAFADPTFTINDDVVQRLVIARQCYADGKADDGEAALEAALGRARRIMGDLVGGADTVAPGSLRRDTAATAD